MIRFSTIIRVEVDFQTPNLSKTKEARTRANSATITKANK